VDVVCSYGNGFLPQNTEIRALLPLKIHYHKGVSILPISQPGIVPPVQAQTNETKKAEAERLFNEGMQLFQQGTAESLQQAITKWEQALPLWRKLEDKAQEAFINLALGKWMVQQGVRS